MPNDVFEAWFEALKSKRIKRYLALTEGTVELTSVQRKLAAEAGKRLRVACVTDDRLVRGIVTAVSWLGVDIKAFSYAEMSDAIKHLGAQDMEEQVMAMIRRLRSACQRLQLSRASTPALKK